MSITGQPHAGGYRGVDCDRWWCLQDAKADASGSEGPVQPPTTELKESSQGQDTEGDNKDQALTQNDEASKDYYYGAARVYGRLVSVV
jgi:hypothetical protein